MLRSDRESVNAAPRRLLVHVDGSAEAAAAVDVAAHLRRGVASVEDQLDVRTSLRLRRRG
jgi:hypothetical protein